MALKLAALHPFKSFLLCEVPQRDGFAPDALIEEIISQLEKESGVFDLERGNPSPPPRRIEVAFVYYKKRSQSPWTRDQAFVDETNHLLVISRRDQYVAVYGSDHALVVSVRKRITASKKQKKKKVSKITQLRLIPAGRLNAAFIKGETQTLWLSGTHRRVSSKVDNKVITGLDLVYALDPLGDQSYYFTAARCRTPLGSTTRFIGLSPKKSFVWAGQSADWNDFAETASIALRKIASQRESKLDPFPVIAAGIDPQNLNNVRGAFDAALIPPEILDPQATDEIRQKVEKWSQMRFKTTAAEGPNFSAKLYMPTDGAMELLGTAAFNFDPAGGDRAQWTVSGKEWTRASDQVREQFHEALQILQREKEWLKVWYDSGHVLAEQAIFLLRYREFPFRNYVWSDLKDYRRDQEKPRKLSAGNIGKDKSLFSWVRNHWRPENGKSSALRGWLASNDGAMEIADFIHLNEGSDPPTLTLIHVKGANSFEKRHPERLRAISVSAYEVVTAQAIKNLRHVDQELLAGNFLERLDNRIKDAVWHNGKKATRTAMLAALQKIRTNYARRVIVFQPQVMKSALDKARSGKGAEQLRVKQLDTLLLTAQMACQSLGAEFYVIADKL
jgi:hypothetical protein